MIRKLAAAEMAWFLGRVLAFQGHTAPLGLAGHLASHLRDARRDAERTLVWQADDELPRAGLHLVAPGPNDDDRTARLGPLWHEGDEDLARTFVATVLGRTPHEAAVVDLEGVVGTTRDAYVSWLSPLGFVQQERVRLRFTLADVPPLGAPLSLEAWSEDSDALFRDIYRSAEGVVAGDGRWAWLKRRGGRFRPDLWFLLRPTPDQAPIGYAFCHGDDSLDGSYRLEAAGVLPEHRDSTVMLRRLVLTTMLELAARSPLGSVDARPDAGDPKLVEILRSLGFQAVDRERRLKRLPD